MSTTIRTKDYRSDIVLTMHMTLGGETVNVPQHDFVLRFFTENNARHYDCGRIKGELLHCSASESDPTELTCYIKNHGLGCGMLQCTYIDLSPNDGMEDGVQRTFSVSELNVELVDDASDDTQAVAGSVIVDINAVLTELEGLQVDLTDLIAAATAATASANSAATRADNATTSAHNAATSANQAASNANSAAGAAEQSQQKNIRSIVYNGAMGDGAANTVRITLNDGTTIEGVVFNGHKGEKGDKDDTTWLEFGKMERDGFHRSYGDSYDSEPLIPLGNTLYIDQETGKIYYYGINNRYEEIGVTVDPTPTAGSSKPVSSGGVAAALAANDKVVFYFDVNGTKYVAEKHWDERIQDWDYGPSDVVVVVEPSKIYVDCTTNYMYVSPWAGAWIKLNEISAREYVNGEKVNEVSIAATGVISKMANGATTSYNLPSSSGTLALASEVAGKQDKLTFDSAPLYGSSNPVTSDGIAQAFESVILILDGLSMGHAIVGSVNSDNSVTFYPIDYLNTGVGDPIAASVVAQQLEANTIRAVGLLLGSEIIRLYVNSLVDNIVALIGSRRLDGGYPQVVIDGNTAQYSLRPTLSQLDTVPTSGSGKLLSSGSVYTALDGKQDSLVSGTSIKTVNGVSLLGSGNVDVSEVEVVSFSHVSGSADDFVADKSVDDIYNAYYAKKLVVGVMQGSGEALMFVLANCDPDSDLYLFVSLQTNYTVTLEWLGVDEYTFRRESTVFATLSQLANKQDVSPITNAASGALTVNEYRDFGTVSALTITMAGGTMANYDLYKFAFTCASDSTTLTLPSGIKLPVDMEMEMAAGRRFECTVDYANCLTFNCWD